MTDVFDDDGGFIPPEQDTMTNPKDKLGIKKPALSPVSGAVTFEVGLAMTEGARKYGRHNSRAIDVTSSVYYDAAMRHLVSWWEGQDTDPESGLPHIVKAIASLFVLRDAQICGTAIDDRPPALPEGWMDALRPKVEALLTKYPDPVKPFTHRSQS